MDIDADVQIGAPETEEAAIEVADPLADAIEDPLSEAAPESSGEAVQMILPPKPGAGPRASDPVASIDTVLSELSGG